jgi:hypothetical protein
VCFGGASPLPPLEHVAMDSTNYDRLALVSRPRYSIRYRGWAKGRAARPFVPAIELKMKTRGWRKQWTGRNATPHRYLVSTKLLIDLTRLESLSPLNLDNANNVHVVCNVRLSVSTVSVGKTEHQASGRSIHGATYGHISGTSAGATKRWYEYRTVIGEGGK